MTYGRFGLAVTVVVAACLLVFVGGGGASRARSGGDFYDAYPGDSASFTALASPVRSSARRAVCSSAIEPIRAAASS
jgi:hypothetical protein